MAILSQWQIARRRPRLFFIDKMTPLNNQYPHLDAYLNRLKQRPSYARVLKEAEPFMKYFPG